jgi:hypothetical protein
MQVIDLQLGFSPCDGIPAFPARMMAQEMDLAQ